MSVGKSWYSQTPTKEERRAAERKQVQKKVKRTYLFSNHLGNPPCIICERKLKFGQKKSYSKAWVRYCQDNHYFLVSINDRSCRVMEQLTSGDPRLKDFFDRPGRKR